MCTLLLLDESCFYFLIKFKVQRCLESNTFSSPLPYPWSNWEKNNFNHLLLDILKDIDIHRYRLFLQHGDISCDFENKAV